MNARYNAMLRYFFTVLSFVSISTSAEPPFGGTIFIDPDIITESDPTTFVSIEAAGQDVRTMYDRRSGWIENNAFLFEANFSDGLSSQVQVNSEFETASAAAIEAEKYAIVIGRLPKALRVDVATYWIHKGVESFGGGNNNLLIHVGQADLYVADGILEETFVHEAAHTSLDAYHASSDAWLTAQEADGEFISTYAEDNPTREDIAESFLPYLAVEFRADRISEDLAETITNTIPNRIAFFNSLDLDLAPITTTSVDSDGDGIVDGEDNCPEINNVDQLNSDSDELGNACDEDDDNDGISDSQEEIEGTDPVDNSSCYLCSVPTSSGGLQVNGGNDEDSLTGTEYEDILSGYAENDLLYGLDGNDTLYGGEGDDDLHGGNGDDTLNGGEGNDVLDGSNGDDILDGGEGNDVLDGSNGDDILDGGEGNDVLDGSNGDDILDGGEGNDVLDGSNGDDILDGGEGNDVLDGSNGDDIIRGGPGYDFIEGGAGINTLEGGLGIDLYATSGLVIATTKISTILDFDNEMDLITSTQKVVNVRQQSSSTNFGNDTLVTYDDGRSIIIQGIEAYDVTVDDFVCFPSTRNLDSEVIAEAKQADCDFDGDEFSNLEELAYSTDPLNPTSFPSLSFSFDLDRDGKALALTDGLITIRHLFGFEGDALVSGAISSNASSSSDSMITAHLIRSEDHLDIDGDGNAQALTDGLLLIRYLFGFTGNALVSDAIGDGAARTNAEDIEAYILERMPE